jgi:hypothetical protein
MPNPVRIQGCYSLPVRLTTPKPTLHRTPAPADWLPRSPTSASYGAEPAAANDRYGLLNEKFANDWRVTDKTSLFDYAPGTC